jgi:hypothetical protein
MRIFVNHLGTSLEGSVECNLLDIAEARRLSRLGFKIHLPVQLWSGTYDIRPEDVDIEKTVTENGKEYFARMKDMPDAGHHAQALDAAVR